MRMHALVHACKCFVCRCQARPIHQDSQDCPHLPSVSYTSLSLPCLVRCMFFMWMRNSGSGIQEGEEG